MATMKLRFDDSLEYQQEAIAAVTDLFDGLPPGNPVFSIAYNTDIGLRVSELGIANPDMPDPDRLLANLHAVQERNGITKVTALATPEFAVEMETGTGKTYVYLRTAFELNRQYGVSKFIIVVPSVAIREGVQHSIVTMKSHFEALYSTKFDHVVYDGKQSNQLRAFAQANTMQLMVINIQAFQRDFEKEGGRGGNLIYRENDRLNGWRPIDYLQETRPFVIIDEPQKVQGKASQAGLARLNPSCMVQYSATFSSPYKVYRLGPIEAHQQRLVKQIEVSSVVEEIDANQAYVQLLNVDIDKQRARIEINTGQGDTVTRKSFWVRQRDDLYTRSGERLEYDGQWIVDTISFDPDNAYVEFANGQEVTLGQAKGSLDDDVMRVQVYETVREHLEKELRLKDQGIKVLSLFFIDRVANYRVYDDEGHESLGKIGQWFEAAYTELTTKYQRFQPLAVDDVGAIHDGYFSVDRKGRVKDTSGKTADDESTYDRIMRNKEKLLSFDDPLRFIFSHSALREGWDNPNVFQICTLKETKSVDSKRQEIGRGLRLPVNQQGERIHDESVNRLTVVANEAYKDFAETLQREYAEEAGIRFGVVPDNAFSLIEIRDEKGKGTKIGQAADNSIRQHLMLKGYLGRDSSVQPKFRPDQAGFELDVPAAYESIRPEITDVIRKVMFEGNHIRNARDRRTLTLNKRILLDPEFDAFWKKISQRTRYRVRLDSDALVQEAALRLRELARPITPPKISVTTHGLDHSYKGIQAKNARRATTMDAQQAYNVPDMLAWLQNETDLTRKTIARIITESDMVEKVLLNPQAFLNAAATAIQKTLQTMMLDGLTYEKLDGVHWDQRQFVLDNEKELTRYLENLYEVQHQSKTVHDYVAYDSAVEQQFAADLDANDAVKFFVKLPSWFRVDTPIGPYNPDWAILLENDDDSRLYLVRETKGTLFTDELRTAEQIKVSCGTKHFATIDVSYAVGTSLQQVLQEVQSGYRV